MPSFYSDAATALPPFITVAFIMYEGGEVSVPDDESIASAARLDPNYPNPFNPSTAIAFTLDQAGAVRLEIYDLRGRLVAMLVDEVLPAGRHEVMWDGTDSSGRAMSSGVYLSRFEANGHVAHGRLSLVQ
jgi:flagellar hook assembly protein FlgD